MNEKNNKIFNKFYMIIPVLLFVVLLFTMTTGSFANSETTDVIVSNYKGIEYTAKVPLSEYNCNYYVVLHCNNSSFIYMYMSKEKMNFNHVGSSYYFLSSGNSDFYLFSGSISGNYIIFNLVGENDTSNYGYTYLCGSNYDIYDDSNNLVFQGAPQVPEITKALVEQTKQVGMSPMEQIKTILPVVLITLVSLIAFWKGLQVISRILYQA